MRDMWLIRLGFKFFKVVPLGTLAVVFLTLLSQVALLLSMLLPLKILMLLGAEGIPAVFPSFFSSFEHDTLIVMLCLLAVSSYITHMIASKAVNLISDYSANKLLASSEKLIIFENQDYIAVNAYKKYAEALASLCFTIAALSVIGALYKELLFFIFLIIILLTSVCMLLARLRPVREKLTDSSSGFYNILSMVIFFSIFAFIIVDYVVFLPPSFLVMLVTVILSRQMLSRIVIIGKNVGLLDNQKNQICALYFHAHAYTPPQEVDRKNVWSLLEGDVSDSLVPGLLEQITGAGEHSVETSWLQAGVNNVIFQEVVCKGSDRRFLLKFFDARKSSSALHESSLLVDPPEGLPAPCLIKFTVVEGFHCHIFEITGCQFIYNSSGKEELKKIRECLLSVRPSKEMVEKYSRSKLMVHERVDHKMLERLKLVASSQEIAAVIEFEQAWPSVKSIIKDAPVAIQAHLNKDICVVAEEPLRPMIVHWADWRLEPAGAGWPATPRDLEALEEFILSNENDISQNPEWLAKTCLIVALVYALENEFRRQRYRSAIGHIFRINDEVRSLDEHPRRLGS